MDCKNQREREILEAAVKVFSKHGFHNSKMQDIADEASIGKGTLYEYFKGKQHLFEEMVSFTIDRYIDGLEEVFDSQKDIEDILLKVAQYHGSFIKDHIDLAQSFINSDASKPVDMKLKAQKNRMRFLKLFNQYVDRAKENNLIKKDADSEHVMMMVMGCLNQFYKNKIFLQEKDISELDPSPMIKMILNGIRP